MLVEAQAYIDARNNGTWRVPLHEAASYGNLAVVKYLLELKAPHLPRSTDDETPIQLAREAGHKAVVEFLGNSYRNLRFYWTFYLLLLSIFQKTTHRRSLQSNQANIAMVRWIEVNPIELCANL